jgi:hypothetical protein
MQSLLFILLLCILIVYTEGLFGRSRSGSQEYNSIDDVEKDPRAKNQFRKFARKEVSEENVDFLRDADKALKSKTKVGLKHDAQKISNKYGPNGKQPVNLSFRNEVGKFTQPGLSKDQIKQNLQGSRNEVRSVMNQDTFNRFKQSNEYRRINSTPAKLQKSRPPPKEPKPPKTKPAKLQKKRR